jgi:CheY-like chemotaxis protein
MAIARQHVEAPVPADRLVEHRVPREVSAVILRCLKKAPEQRFSSAAELASQLSSLETIFADGTGPVGQEPVVTPPEDLATAVRRRLVDDVTPLDLQIEVPGPARPAPDTGTSLPRGDEPVMPSAESAVSQVAFQIVPSAAPHRPSRPVILVVDDDPQVRRVVSLHLTEGGFEPLQAATAMEALDLLTKQPADAVLMDVQMPGMDGFDAVRVLKSQPQFAKLPIFLMSSFAERNRVAFAGQAGAVSFLRKPLNLPQVVKELREALESARKPDGPTPAR